MPHILMKRFMPSAILIALLTGAGSAIAADLPLVSVSPAVSVQDAFSRSYSAKMISPESVKIVSRVSGEIKKVNFRDGGAVKAGDVLYEIDDTRYKAALEVAEGQLMQAEAAYTYAKSDLERKTKLHKQNSVSEDSYDSAVSSERSTYGAYLTAKANVALAQDDLDNTKIVAPINGRTGVTAYTYGNYITPSSGTLVNLQSADPLRAFFALSLRDLSSGFGTQMNLYKNSKVNLKLADGSKYEQPGSISIIDNAADTATDTLMVYADFPNPSLKLVPGSTVTLELTGLSGQTLAAVTPASVLYDDNGSYVWVVEDGTAHRRSVELGSIINNLQSIVSGLKEGENVIVEGSHKVSEGTKVDTVKAGEG